MLCFFFFFQAEDGIRDGHVTGVQTCALPILGKAGNRDFPCLLGGRRQRFRRNADGRKHLQSCRSHIWRVRFTGGISRTHSQDWPCSRGAFHNLQSSPRVRASRRGSVIGLSGAAPSAVRKPPRLHERRILGGSMRAPLFPVKDLRNAKKRLESVLTPEQRLGLAHAMLTDTTRAVRDVCRAEKIFVITNYRPAMEIEIGRAHV